RYKHEQFFLWPLCTHARKRASRPRPIRHVGAPATIYLATDWLTSFEAAARLHHSLPKSVHLLFDGHQSHEAKEQTKRQHLLWPPRPLSWLLHDKSQYPPVPLPVQRPL